MSRLQGNILTTSGQVYSLAGAAKIQPREVPRYIFDLLEKRLPTESFHDMSKKDRKNRGKKSHQLRKERAAQKAAAAKIDQFVERTFMVNGDRDFETGKTLTEFTLFDKLAPELRQMIWKEALPGAQAIKITADGYNYEDRPTLLVTSHRFCYRGKASYVPTALLSVNCESRAIAKAEYPLVFAAQLGGRPIRFNFKKDILYFQCPSAMINFYGGTLPLFNPELQTYGFIHDMSDVHNMVQHVAVGHTDFYKNVVGATLNLYKALKTVMLGDHRVHDPNEQPDLLIKLLTGEQRLIWGWEPLQNFKSVEDGNMPKIKRLEKNKFDDLVEGKYKQIMPKPRPVPALFPMPISFSPAIRDTVARQDSIVEESAAAGLVVEFGTNGVRVN